MPLLACHLEAAAADNDDGECTPIARFNRPTVARDVVVLVVGHLAAGDRDKTNCALSVRRQRQSLPDEIWNVNLDGRERKFESLLADALSQIQGGERNEKTNNEQDAIVALMR